MKKLVAAVCALAVAGLMTFSPTQAGAASPKGYPYRVTCEKGSIGSGEVLTIPCSGSGVSVTFEIGPRDSKYNKWKRKAKVPFLCWAGNRDPGLSC